MAWVNIEERLPAVGREVPVFGDFTPETVPFPRASVNDLERRKLTGLWSSREWRGTVGIQFWWEEGNP